MAFSSAICGDRYHSMTRGIYRMSIQHGTNGTPHTTMSSISTLTMSCFQPAGYLCNTSGFVRGNSGCLLRLNFTASGFEHPGAPFMAFTPQSCSSSVAMLDGSSQTPGCIHISRRFQKAAQTQSPLRKSTRSIERDFCAQWTRTISR